MRLVTLASVCAFLPWAIVGTALAADGQIPSFESGYTYKALPAPVRSQYVAGISDGFSAAMSEVNPAVYKDWQACTSRKKLGELRDIADRFLAANPSAHSATAANVIITAIFKECQSAPSK